MSDPRTIPASGAAVCDEHGDDVAAGESCGSLGDVQTLIGGRS